MIVIHNPDWHQFFLPEARVPLTGHIDDFTFMMRYLSRDTRQCEWWQRSLLMVSSYNDDIYYDPFSPSLTGDTSGNAKDSSNSNDKSSQSIGAGFFTNVNHITSSAVASRLIGLTLTHTQLCSWLIASLMDSRIDGAIIDMTWRHALTIPTSISTLGATDDSKQKTIWLSASSHELIMSILGCMGITSTSWPRSLRQRSQLLESMVRTLGHHAIMDAERQLWCTIDDLRRSSDPTCKPWFVVGHDDQHTLTISKRQIWSRLLPPTK
jgi:hypothetical protein